MRILASLMLALYLSVVVYFLHAASPLVIDGGGPLPNFTWAELPRPDLAEYTRHRSLYDLVYSIPYCCAGMVLTAVGCGLTPVVLRKLRLSPVHDFRNAVMLTALLSLVAAGLSDLGGLLGMWRAPIFVLHGNWDGPSIRALSCVLIPTSILSGVVAVGAVKVPSQSRS